jgi:YVTN family beta-propeller protein
MANAKSVSGYHLAKTVHIGGEGGWDYLIVDDEARRLYVTHASKVHVLNADTLDIVGEIPTQGAHGVAIASPLGYGFASNGATDTVTVFDLRTLGVVGQVAVGQNPDSIRYDPASRKVFVFNGRSHDASVIDAATQQVVATIPLGGKVEFSVADGNGRVYVNNEDKSEVDVIDSRTLKHVAQYQLGPGQAPTGLALDPRNRRLFSVCRNKFMVVLDADSGSILASLPIGNGSDGCGFDTGTGFAFSSNGEGTLTVVRENPQGVYEVFDTVTTRRAGRTMTIDPRTHSVFIPTAEQGPTPAPTPEQPRPRPAIIPDTFVLMQFQR